jgi:molecular chaperone HtpG
MPEAYNILVNMQNPLIAKIWGGKKEAADTAAADFAKDNELLQQIVDLALLGNGMLKGKALSDFIARSEKLLK